jgi:hypothetical protein
MVGLGQRSSQPADMQQQLDRMGWASVDVSLRPVVFEIRLHTPFQGRRVVGGLERLCSWMRSEIGSSLTPDLEWIGEGRCPMNAVNELGVGRRRLTGGSRSS